MSTANVVVPTLRGDGNTPLDGLGFNLSAATFGFQYAQVRYTFLGPMDYARGFIFVINSPTLAPDIPRNTTYPNAQ